MKTDQPSDLPPLTSDLVRLADGRRAAYEEACAARGLDPAALDPALSEQRRVVWALSDFAALTCIRRPALLAELVASGDLLAPCPAETYRQRVSSALADVADEPALKTALRVLRAREMVRIAWRDLSGLADLGETVGELSALAEAILDGALGWLHKAQARELGTPRTADGAPQQLVVLALGKLGGEELNFSSDVDLLFAVPQEGTVVGGRRERTSSEWLLRLGQRLITVLGERTADGFVYRVDMRLRPFGGAGPLVMTFDGLEGYYQTHGREWERYALIKARPVAGDVAAGASLLDALRPFVFRRYLDYGAVESLREMKALVATEVARKGMQSDLKLGPGGIREVEFVAQVFQLIRGGREPGLQCRGLLPALAALGEGGHLPAEAVAELAEAYTFLRRAEHRVQEVDDRQTQSLPADPLGQARLACAMGFSGWADFSLALQARRGRVERHFRRVFAAPDAGPEPQAADRWSLLWLGRLPAEEGSRLLASARFNPAEEALARVEDLRAGHAVQLMRPQGRQRLDRLMPLLLVGIGQSQAPLDTLRRVVPLLEATARRSVYLALLLEHPEALAQLVRLCSASPWIAEHLARYPILLDELLDPRTLYTPPDRDGLARELAQQLARVAPGDAEQELEALRLFKQVNVLRVAAADVSQAIPLMVVSDHLTWIAEVVLEQVLALAERDLTARHGRPRCRVAGEVVSPSFGIIAYGKLGGIELGYASDLDLVFLHTSRGEDQVTDGDRPVANEVFYARLAQRIVHLLTARTGAGVLYEVDFRLRPSGSSGLLVSSLDAFDEYQRHQAWTWEHQALVRARPVVANAELAGRFGDVRRRALTRQRDPETLRREVREMREKMRSHLGSQDAARFDLKQGPGGIADIEFLVQYHALRWGCEHPEILRYTDNVRLLEGLTASGRLPAADAALLKGAYLAYRARLHELALQGLGGVVEAGELGELRDRVTALWQRLMEA